MDLFSRAGCYQYKIVFEGVDGYRQQMPLALLYEQYPVAFPLSNLPHISGENQYQAGTNYLIKSVRDVIPLIGRGQLGPDLNFPRSVTEYRSKSFMRDFISHPQAYRYNSKMVAAVLDDQEFEMLYGYFKGMSAYTVD